MDQEVALAVTLEGGDDRNVSDQSTLTTSEKEKGVALIGVRVRHAHSPSAPY